MKTGKRFLVRARLGRIVILSKVQVVSLLQQNSFASETDGFAFATSAGSYSCLKART